jgi:Ni,Fe-hydrogenase III small subunit
MPSIFQKIFQTGIVTEPLDPDFADSIQLGQQIDQTARRLLGRALAIREVDAGSCNGCEIEITGLTSPVYDSERFGVHFVASPRHADMLLVTGPVTRNMEIPLRKTYDATPDPKLVVAVGDCAQSCGVFKGSYAVAGSVDQIIPVDVFVHGCPPEPADILRGILTALGKIQGK